MGAGGASVEALSYQSNVSVGFTFNPTLTVSLSSSDLVISNLSPGARSDSNIITVGVSTNAAYGYDLLATVGNASNATTELKNGNNSFTALSSNTATLASFDDNKWGYSYSTDSGTSWVSGDQGSASTGYAGLPLYTGTGVKMASANSNTDSSVQFKIAAKAGATQASGEYTNVVNFAAVSKVGVVTLLDAFVASNATQQNGYYTMQGMTPAICNAAAVGSSMQLLDVRDNKMYWVAKLADNKCWMTQNLELDLVANSTTIDSTNTNINPSSYNATTGAYSTAGGYTKDDTTGVVTWSPARDTVDSLNASNFPSDDAAYNTPYSYNSGDRYYYYSGGSQYDYSYTLSECRSQGHEDCEYYKAGNYYNWSAAIASNNTSPIQSNYAGNSICPKGWRLPRDDLADFSTLGSAYGVVDETPTVLKMSQGPLYFVRSGYVLSGSVVQSGHEGYCWSGSASSDIRAFALGFYYSSSANTAFHPSNASRRYYGFSVRCIAE